MKNSTTGIKKFILKNKLLILATAYFLFPIDVIPDLIPVFGYGDDALVLLATLFINYKKRIKNDEKNVVEGELADE